MADVLTPLYSGRLIDAVASGAATDEVAWNAALSAFFTLLALATGSLVFRQLSLRRASSG